MKRLLLYLNGILAIRTPPLDQDTMDFRIESWQRIYGHGVKIEVENV